MSDRRLPATTALLALLLSAAAHAEAPPPVSATPATSAPAATATPPAAATVTPPATPTVTPPTAVTVTPPSPPALDPAPVVTPVVSPQPVPAPATMPKIESPTLAVPEDKTDARTRPSFLPPEPKAEPKSETAPAPAVLPAALEPGAPAPVSPAPATGEPASPTAIPPQATSAAPAVTTEKLAPIDPNSAGLLSLENGGLGNTIWKKTPYELANTLIAQLPLPTESKTLNDLGLRLLASISEPPLIDKYVVPEKEVPPFTARRVERLLALGRVADARGILALMPTRLADSATRLRVAELSLLDPAQNDVCDTVADQMPAELDTGWQRVLIVCQVRTKKNDAAQLSLAALKESGIKDDTFMALVERAANPEKQPPRQLTPVKPTMLALAHDTDVPLPAEAFNRADGALTPALLRAKAAVPASKLTLGEHAAARGQIDAATLKLLYQGPNFPADAMANVQGLVREDAKSRAMLVQAILGDSGDKAILIQNLIASTKKPAFVGTMGLLISDFLSTIKPADVMVEQAYDFALVQLLAGKTEAGLTWVELLRKNVAKAEDGAEEMNRLWPLIALSGTVATDDVTSQMQAWADATIEAELPLGSKFNPKLYVATVAGLMHALNIRVPETLWPTIAETTAFKPVKAPLLPPALAARWGAPDIAKGEIVSLAILQAGAENLRELPPSVAAGIAKRLMDAGFENEARAFVREIIAQAML